MRPGGVNRRRAAAAWVLAAAGLAVGGCASTTVVGTAASAPASSSAPAPASSSASGAAPASGAASAAGSGTCAAGQLKVSLTHTTAQAGQAGGYLAFTNNGSTTCHLSGWPAVTGLTAAGKATTLRHLQSSMFGAWTYSDPPPTVTLKPGDSAYAIIAADDKPAGNSTSCPAPYTQLRVSPPGDSDSVTISARLPGANSYLPACAAADGSPTAGTSTVTTLASLPH
jgi:Protein of unknown function (DUF4232)